MTSTETTASLALQEKRKKYPEFSGEKLKNKLIPQFGTMKCVKKDEVHLAETRMLRVINYVVTDVTDELNPRVVPEDEVYLIGW